MTYFAVIFFEACAFVRFAGAFIGVILATFGIEGTSRVS